jgi:hypothetical protein
MFFYEKVHVINLYHVTSSCYIFHTLALFAFRTASVSHTVLVLDTWCRMQDGNSESKEVRDVMHHPCLAREARESSRLP